jgi:integrase
MPHARWVKLKSGKRAYYLVLDDGTSGGAAGTGEAGKALAHQWAVDLKRRLRSDRAGFPLERECAWTVKDLKAADLADARHRGLRTALPQLTGSRGGQSKRESHWKNLVAFFGEATGLDDITETRIRQYVASHKPVAANRDLFGVLRPALRLARETGASGYSGDPFQKLKKADERRGRREPIALSKEDTSGVIRACWETDARLGAFIELLYLTASRLTQIGHVHTNFLLYPGHKGGLPRRFALAGRLAALMALPRVFSRKRWLRAVTACGRPELHPHDLRHTRLTHEGDRRGATLLSVQRLGGWRSPAMAGVYLHGGTEPIRVPEEARRKRSKRPKRTKRR